MKRWTLRLGPLDYLGRRLRAAGADALARGAARSGSAQLACFPRDYIGRIVVAQGAYEDLLLRCLFEGPFAALGEDFRHGAVLDVGANIGNHSAWFARHFAEVIGVEPNPVCAHLFRASMLLNGFGHVRLLEAALSDHDGRARLRLDVAGNLGGARLHTAGDEDAAGFDVAVLKGDEALATLGLSHPLRLLKLDVEGHEHAALRGLEASLRRDAPLVLFESLGADGPDGSAAILARLLDLGYRYVYVLQQGDGGGALARALRRLFGGYRVQVVQVEQPADGYHSLVLASPVVL